MKYVDNSLIDSRNSAVSKEILANENPNKIIDIVEKILNFNKNEKDKGFTI